MKRILSALAGVVLALPALPARSVDAVGLTVGSGPDADMVSAQNDFLATQGALNKAQSAVSIAEIIESGSSSDRQRRVAEQHDGALVPVVDSLIAELKA